MRAAETREWGSRIAGVLAGHPDTAGELDLLVQALRECLPAQTPDDPGGPAIG